MVPVDWADGRPTVRLPHGETGQMKLVFSNRREVRINGEHGEIKGALDSVRVAGNMLMFTGWGADLAENRPVVDVLIFAGEHLVSRVEPASNRIDIVERYEQQELLHSGFYATVPVEVLETYGSEIHVVLISEDDRTLDVFFHDRQKDMIHAARETGVPGQ
jgi:hypothetical protein